MKVTPVSRVKRRDAMPTPMKGERSVPTRNVLRRLKWTKGLARSFWRELAGTDFLEKIAFSRFASVPLVDLVEPHLQPTDLIFDFGGGDNLYLVRELLRRGYRVGCYEPHAHIKERNADLAKLPNYLGSETAPKPGTYDCLFISEVIEHLEESDLDRVLQTVVSSLKPHGLLVVTTPDSEDLFAASRYCPICKHLFHPWGHVRSFTATTLEQTLTNYGVKCEELHTVDFSSMRLVVEQAKESAVALAESGKRLSS